MPDLLLDPISPDEFEISLFGRGFGECACVHVGNGRWVVIDSFRNSDRRPVALEYLTALGVDVAAAVPLIIATHWHDDHIKGIADLYNTCASANISFSRAMLLDEFNAYVAKHETTTLAAQTNGVQELSEVARHRQQAARNAPFFASAHTTLLRDIAKGVEIEALSPSDDDFQRFLEAIRKRDAEQSEFSERASPFGRNDVSVVVRIRFGSASALMGADLENGRNDTTGWRAVVSSPRRDPNKSQYFKVAHHGSPKSHWDPAWAQMLTDEPLVALAPWNKGKKLPSQADVKRIMGITPNAYITNSRSDAKLKVGIAAVDNMIREAGIDLRRGPPRLGQVRVRVATNDPSAPWRIDVAGDAVPLSGFQF